MNNDFKNSLLKSIQKTKTTELKNPEAQFNQDSFIFFRNMQHLILTGKGEQKELTDFIDKYKIKFQPSSPDYLEEELDNYLTKNFHIQSDMYQKAENIYFVNPVMLDTCFKTLSHFITIQPNATDKKLIQKECVSFLIEAFDLEFSDSSDYSTVSFLNGKSHYMVKNNLDFSFFSNFYLSLEATHNFFQSNQIDLSDLGMRPTQTWSIMLNYLKKVASSFKSSPSLESLQLVSETIELYKSSFLKNDNAQIEFLEQKIQQSFKKKPALLASLEKIKLEKTISLGIDSSQKFKI